MKVGVTGAAGMLGSHLCDILCAENITVKAVDNLSVGSIDNLRNAIESPVFDFQHLDVKCLSSLDDYFSDCDVIVHLAAQKKVVESQSAIVGLTENYDCTHNILEIARKHSSSVVFASTSDVYGISPNVPFKETDNLVLGPSTAKRWAYAVSKLFGEHLCLAYEKDYGVKTVILRYFGGFSERSSSSWSGGHVPIFINALINNEVVMIHGDGNQTRSMGHAYDLARGTWLAIKNIDSVHGNIINIGNDQEVSVIETLYIIAEYFNIPNSDIKLEFIPEQKIFGDYKDIRRRVPCLQKAYQLLGYKPNISLKDALRIVCDFRLSSGSMLPDAY